MIKGHAVIELKDVETGAVQRVEHDNMVTNGLKYCLTPWMGKFSYATGGSTPQKMLDETTETRKSGNRSMMNHLLGGIFLFQNNLEEDVDNTAFPLDNPLTGKASWDAYNGIDTYRGSYNEKESGLQDDGSYKHVWDFSTSQANGQISALALTTYKGGICGNGFKDWNSTETAIREEPFFNVGQIRISKEREGEYCSPFLRVSSNEVYYVADQYCLTYNAGYADRYLGNAGKIFFKKKKFPLGRLSPFYDYYNQFHSEDVEIEIPEEFAIYAANGQCRGRTSDSYLYIYKYIHEYNTTMIAGDSYKILRIKKSDLSVEVITLTNNTPYAMMREVDFTDDFCFLRTNSNPYSVYAVKIADNEIVHLGINISSELRKIGDYIYGKENTNHTYCINPETMETKCHPEFNINNVANNWYGSTEKITPNVYLQFVTNYYKGLYNYADIYISANTLMTVNNLLSPVVKTAAQTMKITYTIQETEE